MTMESNKTINSTPFCHPELVSRSEKGVHDIMNRIIIVTDAEMNSA